MTKLKESALEIKMTAISPYNSQQNRSQQARWQTVLFASLAFWLSGSFLLDGIVMPSMYASGMMTEPGFATAGYSLFWLFNRVELLCAALVLTCVLVLRYSQRLNRPGQLTLLLAGLLVAIALIDTYALTPRMSALGLRLNWFTPGYEAPAAMNQLHLGYWLLESLKLTACAGLLWFYNRISTPGSQG